MRLQESVEELLARKLKEQAKKIKEGLEKIRTDYPKTKQLRIWQKDWEQFWNEYISKHNMQKDKKGGIVR